MSGYIHEAPSGAMLEAVALVTKGFLPDEYDDRQIYPYYAHEAFVRCALAGHAVLEARIEEVSTEYLKVMKLAGDYYRGYSYDGGDDITVRYEASNYYDPNTMEDWKMPIRYLWDEGYEQHMLEEKAAIDAEIKRQADERKAAEDALAREKKRLNAIAREQEELAHYERLKAKYGGKSRVKK